jgi:hypothetical protein
LIEKKENNIKQFYLNNKEKRLQYNKEWRLKNKEKNYNTKKNGI